MVRVSFRRYGQSPLVPKQTSRRVTESTCTAVRGRVMDSGVAVFSWGQSQRKFCGEIRKYISQSTVMPLVYKSVASSAMNWCRSSSVFSSSKKYDEMQVSRNLVVIECLFFSRIGRETANVGIPNLNFRETTGKAQSISSRYPLSFMWSKPLCDITGWKDSTMNGRRQ